MITKLYNQVINESKQFPRIPSSDWGSDFSNELFAKIDVFRGFSSFFCNFSK